MSTEVSEVGIIPLVPFLGLGQERQPTSSAEEGLRIIREAIEEGIESIAALCVNASVDDVVANLKTVGFLDTQTSIPLDEDEEQAVYNAFHAWFDQSGIDPGIFGLQLGSMEVEPGVVRYLICPSEAWAMLSGQAAGMRGEPAPRIQVEERVIRMEELQIVGRVPPPEEEVVAAERPAAERPRGGVSTGWAVVLVGAALGVGYLVAR